MDTMTYAAFAAFRGYVAEKENPPSCFLKAHADLPPCKGTFIRTDVEKVKNGQLIAEDIIARLGKPLGKSSVRKVPRHL